MKSTRFLFLLAGLAVLPGCATLFGAKSDQLTIHSNDPNAKILVDGNQVGTGSAVYALPRDKTAIITASKKGCQDMSVPTQRAVNPTTFLNTIFLVFYLVDAVTGAIYEAQPTSYTVTPNCA